MKKQTKKVQSIADVFMFEVIIPKHLSDKDALNEIDLQVQTCRHKILEEIANRRNIKLQFSN